MNLKQTRKNVNKSYVDGTPPKIGQTDERRKKKSVTSPAAEVMEHWQVIVLLFLIWNMADVKIWSDNVHQIICALHQRCSAIIMYHKDGGSSWVSSSTYCRGCRNKKTIDFYKIRVLCIFMYCWRSFLTFKQHCFTLWFNPFRFILSLQI